MEQLSVLADFVLTALQMFVVKGCYGIFGIEENFSKWIVMKLLKDGE